jgi:hypothetical protein
MKEDFNDQRLMGVPANPPLTLFLEGAELAAALRQRKTLFLDQLATSSLSVGLLARRISKVPPLKISKVGILRRAQTTQTFRAAGSFLVECSTRPVRKYHGNLKELVRDLAQLSQRQSRVIFVHPAWDGQNVSTTSSRNMTLRAWRFQGLKPVRPRFCARLNIVFLR